MQDHKGSSLEQLGTIITRYGKKKKHWSAFTIFFSSLWRLSQLPPKQAACCSVKDQRWKVIDQNQNTSGLTPLLPPTDSYARRVNCVQESAGGLTPAKWFRPRLRRGSLTTGWHSTPESSEMWPRQTSVCAGDMCCTQGIIGTMSQEVDERKPKWK